MPDEDEVIPAFPGRSYVDTSALAKWYLNEEQSDRVDEYLRSLPFAGISSLTLVEMRCLLARRRRYAEITREQELRCYALFRQDIQEGHLQVEPLAYSAPASGTPMNYRLGNWTMGNDAALELTANEYADIVAIIRRIYLARDIEGPAKD